MFCKKCSYILSGSESYCPSCGTPCEKVFDEKEAESPASIFGTGQVKSQGGTEIFEDNMPYVKENKKEKKSKSGVAFAAVLILATVAAAAIVAADYLDISPAISTIFEKVSSAVDKDSTTTTVSEYSSSAGTVTPSVVYDTTVAYNAKSDGQALRKGPDETYAEIQNVPYSTLVHILGASDSQALWVYVYIPEDDVYGWLMSSYLSDERPEEEFDETSEEETTAEESTETTTETTTEATTQKVTEETTTKEAVTETTKSPEELSVNETENYTATVTALQGVYMRKGPSTSYEAVTVLGNGETVTVKGSDSEDGNWLYISYGDMTGYVNGAYLEKAE